MKVLFLGSSTFSKIVLNKMYENGVDIKAVITQPDRPASRGHKLQPTEVKKYAIEKGIDVYTFDKVRNHIEEIEKIDYDLAVVASFGQILPQSFLDLKLTINVHPSLLPKYRGATPIQSAILNGDKETGVTIMKVAKEVDSGDIILQQKFEINEEYYLELEDKLASIGGEMVCKVIDGLEKNNITFTPQNHSKAILVSKLTKDDAILDFNCKKETIINKVRALSECVGCFINIGDIKIKIGKVKDATDLGFNVSPCEILNYKKAFIIGCEDGAVEIVSCQAPSGKMIGGRDYINGHSDVLGKKVL